MTILNKEKNILTVMEKIKKYWKEILLVFFVLLSLNKCTVACNRDSKIHKQEAQIELLDSTISALKADTLAKAHQIDILSEKINTANERVNVAAAKSETAKANEATAKATADAANAKAAAARAEAARARAEKK